MSYIKPRVSIGIPVFNGENFLAEALDSILGQTFQDFEIIISDNGSTDTTEKISRSYAAKDERVRYYRHEDNLGAAKNFNFTFEKSSGEYFKWAAHDDICAPDFLNKCVKILDDDPSIVLCHPKTKIIDENGQPMLNYVAEIDTTSESPYQRLKNIILTEHWSYQVFGVFRSDTLNRTSLIGGYTDSDMVLLVESCLLGRIYEIPQHLFFRREHPNTSTNLYKSHQERMEWFDPKNICKKQSPMWLKFSNYFLAIKRTPISHLEKVLCYWQLLHWIIEKTFLRLARKLNFYQDRSHLAVPVKGVEWQ